MTGPCDGEVCVTCSDQAVEVTVLAVRPDATADVDTGLGVEEISVALVEAAVGDVVLVHAKEAIATVPATARRAPDGPAGPDG